MVENYKLKLKNKLSDDTINLVWGIIDGLYYCPREHYKTIPFFKNEFRKILEEMSGKKIPESIHKEILTRD